MTEQTGAQDADGRQSDRPSTPPPSSGGWLLSLVLCVGIALIGAAVIGFIFQTEPTATRGGATRETAMLVDVTTVEADAYRPTIVVTGAVHPAREIVIRPRIEGQIAWHGESLVPGGIVSADETLVRLDRADYEQSLRQARSGLDQALAELRMEQGRQRVAEREYRLTNQDLAGESRALALREPQLDVARARVASARAEVERARLALERTAISAPFDAQVISRAIDVGSQVAAGDALARLVGTQTYWVEATVPVSKLRWLRFPEGDTTGAPVQVTNTGAWPEGDHRSGHLFRLVGSLDDSTRMARVLIAVDDPLARTTANDGAPRLLLGSFVEARIEGQRLEDVVRLDRRYVRGDDTVWVMADGRLDIRPVDIAVSDRRHVYIRDGLTDGERVVTSSLATIREGAPLRLDGEPGGGDRVSAAGGAGQ